MYLCKKKIHILNFINPNLYLTLTGIPANCSRCLEITVVVMEIMVYKVLNMEHKCYTNASVHFRRPLLTPVVMWSTFYDGWIYFFGACNSQQPFTAIKKLGRARTFLILLGLYLSERKMSYSHGMPWG